MAPGDRRRLAYALEDLYRHQDFDFVVDAIPHVLAWLQSSGEGVEQESLTFRLTWTAGDGAEPREMEIAIRWSIGALEQHDADLRLRIERLRSGRTVKREQVTQYAAYGLALVAISLFFPERRVVSMPEFEAPDFLLDATPGALRGVEVAGRSSGGFSVLRAVRLEKSPKLIARRDIAEVHLSLWSADPRVSELTQVKPWQRWTST